jgi:hypothetical protein
VDVASEAEPGEIWKYQILAIGFGRNILGGEQEIAFH